MMGNFAEYVKMAIHNILANKGRSFLTMLGIIIGIASVIAIVSLGQGTTNQMNSEIDDVGAGQGHPLPAGAVAVFDEVSGGRPSGAEQQPCRAQHQALRDGQKELAVYQYSRWRASQCSDLQSD